VKTISSQEETKLVLDKLDSFILSTAL